MTPATQEEAPVKPLYKLDDLTWVKLMIPQLIPMELITEVRGRTFTPEDFIAYQVRQIQYGNANNLLFALVDPKKKIHGFLWAALNSVDGSLFINTFSVAKEYWGKGEAIPKVTKFLEALKGKHGFKRVFWFTTNSKAFQKFGFKKSKNVLMEYVDDGTIQNKS